VSIRRILSRVSGREDTYSVLIETLKVDTSLPKSLDSEKESIDKRITDILEKLNPDLIYDILNQVKAGKLSSEVLQTLLPAFLELIKKYSEELKKERQKYDDLRKRVIEETRDLLQIRLPLLDFLSKRIPPENKELNARKTELQSFSEELQRVRSSVENVGAKLTELESKISALEKELIKFSPEKEQTSTAPATTNPISQTPPG
jgi:chromosome segregation ATPase